MRDRFFNLLTVLSLLLSVVVSALWISSYRRSMVINWVHDNGSANESRLERMKVSLGSLRGGFSLFLDHDDGETAEAVKDLLYYYNWHPAVEMFTDSVKDIDALPNYSQLPPQSYLFMPTSPSPLGFQFNRRSGLYHGDKYWALEAGIPYWFPLTVCALPGMVFVWFARCRRNRSSRGLCPDCGYDLRATPTRCPECGTLTSRGRDG